MYTPRFSLIPYLIAFLVLTGTIYYGYTQYQDLKGAKDEIAANTEAVQTLQTDLNTVKEEYDSTHGAASDTELKKQNDIEEIFPEQEKWTDLTREIEDFFIKNNRSNSPLFVSNVTYGMPTATEDADYTILPVKMTIESSRPNFFKFLEWIENSGSFENKLRLMSIKNINIRFNEKGETTLEGDTSSGEEIVSYSVDLNAYFKKQVEVKK